MMRITTNTTLYTYQKNLMKSSNQLYSAMNSVITGRNFDTYAADPAAATRPSKSTAPSTPPTPRPPTTTLC